MAFGAWEPARFIFRRGGSIRSPCLIWLGGMDLPCTSAVERHDYARTWRKVRPAERDRRISQALARLTEGETLAQVAATWSMSAGSLCRVLLAYAPGEWRRALAARAMVRYEEAAEAYAADPQNSIARGKAWATRWHFDYSLSKLANVPALSALGGAYLLTCPKCTNLRAAWRPGQAIRCYGCDWEADARRYLLGESQAPATGAASR